MKQYKPPHPSEIFIELFLIPSIRARLSPQLKEKEEYIYDFLKGKIDINEELAELLSVNLGTTKKLWLNLQERYDQWKRENEE